MIAPDFSDRLQKVYEAEDSSSLARCYDDWAQTYDRDLAQVEYRFPAIAAAMVTRYVRSTGAALLDAGVGTGVIGELLNVLGYQHIVGVDLSEGMLEQAKTRRVYKALYQMNLLETLDFPDDAFFSSFVIGVFALGHVGPEAFDELLRVTRPGGYLIFSVSKAAYEAMGFGDRLSNLEVEGRWRFAETTPPFVMYPTGGSAGGLKGQVIVYQVT